MCCQQERLRTVLDALRKTSEKEIEQRKSGAKLTASNHGPCFALPDILDEELEALWARNLRRFLAERLIPLGGVRVGRSTDGTLAIALTDAGRYLLALSEDFEYGEVEKAEIVVQPNFDIVFVTPSPAAEAALSRFAQRVGRRALERKLNENGIAVAGSEVGLNRSPTARDST